MNILLLMLLPDFRHNSFKNNCVVCSAQYRKACHYIIFPPHLPVFTSHFMHDTVYRPTEGASRMHEAKSLVRRPPAFYTEVSSKFSKAINRSLIKNTYDKACIFILCRKEEFSREKFGFHPVGWDAALLCDGVVTKARNITSCPALYNLSNL